MSDSRAFKEMPLSLFDSDEVPVAASAPGRQPSYIRDHRKRLRDRFMSGGAAALLGGLLNIKPILTVKDGRATTHPIAGTRWAAYNAVTEYVDHYSKVRAAGDPQSVRALRAVTGGSTAQTLKTNAFRMLQTL